MSWKKLRKNILPVSKNLNLQHHQPKKGGGRGSLIRHLIKRWIHLQQWQSLQPLFRSLISTRFVSTHGVIEVHYCILIDLAYEWQQELVVTLL